MGAPTPGTRSTPTGFKMPEGFRALITLSGKTNIQLWERDVKPPGIDGGEAIDTTTQHNKLWHTTSPRTLRKMDQATFNAAYDPDVISDIINQINRNQTVTVLFPDGSTWCFYGALIKWEPSDLKEGEFPMASCTVTVTNTDPTDFSEQGPVFTAASGT